MSAPSGGGPRRRRLVMATALASTAAATAVAGGATIPAGLAGAGIDVVDVRVEDLVSISATGAWKPLLALQVTVPAGTSANLLVRYTAATQCHGSSCSIRMRLVAADGSTRMLGAGRFAAPVARGASMVETAEFVAANVDAGSYWVRVDGFVAGVEVGFSWFENQVLVVEQVRAGGRPASEVRPVVATQAAIADPFDASIADPRWQTIVSTRVVVPEGETSLLLARFGAASRCDDASGLVDPVHEKCEAVIRFRRIVPGGFQFVDAFPGGPVTFDDTSTETYRAQRMEAVSGPVGRGTYEILVRGSQAQYWRLQAPILVVDRVRLVSGSGVQGLS